jgi:hypothetical protein
MMNAADEYKSPAALSAVECELISVNNENVWFNMIIMIDMHDACPMKKCWQTQGIWELSY